MKRATIIVLVLVLVALGFYLRFQIIKNDDPIVLTTNFYNDWTLGKYSIKDQSYLQIDVWTNKLKDKIKGVVTGPIQDGYDPVLCADGLPDHLQIISQNQTAKTAQLEVHESYGFETAVVKIDLVKSRGFWRLDNISCPNETARTNKDHDHALVETYLRAHISDLSPVKEAVGGKFYITNITFNTDNSGLVTYEDGHISISAYFVYNLNASGEVEISRFIRTEQ